MFSIIPTHLSGKQYKKKINPGSFFQMSLGLGYDFTPAVHPLPTDAIPDVWLCHRLDPPITALNLKPIEYNLALGFVMTF